MIVPIVGAQVLLPYQRAIKINMDAARIPRLVDVVTSCREKAIITSCCRKAGLCHTDIARIPRSRVLFYFLFEGRFYFVL